MMCTIHPIKSCRLTLIKVHAHGSVSPSVLHGRQCCVHSFLCDHVPAYPWLHFYGVLNQVVEAV